ncbi:hypothetical protein YC2023_077338 [Brassica napus]
MGRVENGMKMGLAKRGTHLRCPHIPEIRVKEKKEEEQPLSPAARQFHAPKFNCNIISVVVLKSKIKPDVIIEGIKQTLIRHPRFSCKLIYNGGVGKTIYTSTTGTTFFFDV